MLNHSYLVRAVGLAIALLVLSATSVFADTVTFTGTTVGGPMWNRPVQGTPPTPPPSGVGTAVRYSVTQLTVSLTGTYTFQCTGTSPAAWDNYTFMYQNSFNPASQFTNVLIGNDDNPTIGLSGFSLTLNVGTTYFFIVTGFANADAGAWSTVASGQGTITVGGGPGPVPEPMSLLLLGTGLAGVAAKLRRRKVI
jgi:hypothetical protein